MHKSPWALRPPKELQPPQQGPQPPQASGLHMGGYTESQCVNAFQSILDKALSDRKSVV